MHRRPDIARTGDRDRRQYGQAQALLAPPYVRRASRLVMWSTAAPIAERAALAAVTADSEDAWAHTALGRRLFLDAPARRLARGFELALELNAEASARTLAYERWRLCTSGPAATPVCSAPAPYP